MEREPRFIGRKYSEKEIEIADKAMSKWSKEDEATMEGEVEKTEEEIHMIDVANNLIGTELASLGIQGYTPIEIKKIHFITSGDYESSTESGTYSAVSNRVIVNKSGADTKPRLLTTLVHELLHHASTRRFYEDTEGGISESRVGYRIRSPWKEPLERKAFTGFNEMMVDFTVIKIFAHNYELIEKGLGITKEELHGPNFTYMQYGPLLEKIVRGVSAHKEISLPTVFDNLERGLFDTTILPVKEIERTFGKGSLRILSYLGSLKDVVLQKELDQMVMRYFDTEDSEGKKQLEKEAEAFFTKNRLLEVAAESRT